MQKRPGTNMADHSQRMTRRKEKTTIRSGDASSEGPIDLEPHFKKIKLDPLPDDVDLGLHHGGFTIALHLTPHGHRY